MRLRALVLLVVGLSVACGQADGVVTDPIAAPAGAGAWLVWATDGERSETVWIDANGAEVARHDGIHLAAGTHVWRVERHEGRATGLDCECVMRTDPSFATTPEACKIGVPTQVVTAVDLLSTEHIDLVTAPTLASVQDGESSPGVNATIVGTVGPYLFLETYGYSFGCGAAHGNGWFTYDVIDTTTSGRLVVDALSASEVTGIKTAETATVLSRELANDGSVFNPDAYTVTELRPRWQEDGKLVTEAQLTWDACYACSDGLWASYTRSIRVPTQVPTRLQPYAAAPAPVVAWWAAHPPPLTTGWSEVQPGQEATALAAFQR